LWRYKLNEVYNRKPRISIQIDPQRSWTRKKYRPFKITKNIGQEAFQLELLKGWAIHNVFNKDLLI